MWLSIRLPFSRVINQHHPIGFADHFAFILSHYNPGAFIQSNPQQCRPVVRFIHLSLRIGEHFGEIKMSKARNHMLINCYITQKSETTLMIANQNITSIGISPHEECALDRGAGGAAANHSTACEHFFKRCFGSGSGVGINQPPLPPASKPHRISLE